MKIHKDIFGRVSVWVGGVEQSGKWVSRLWETGLKRMETDIPDKVLVLGLGAGSLIKFLNKAKRIVGVELDSEMVEIGKKYFGLDKKNIEIKIIDAKKYITKEKFDLILVDLYVGNQFPKKFESGKFLEKVSHMVSKRGVVIFNRLTGKNIDFEPNKFIDKLNRYLVVSKVEKIDWNYLFYCGLRG